jgi:hypothetical protein
VGRPMTTADTYRRYAAECLSMSKRQVDMNEKVLLLEMATSWLRLAEFVERNEGADDSSPAF